MTATINSEDLAAWDPAATDGCSEDWLEGLLTLGHRHRVVRTPTGVAFTRAADVAALLDHPSVKVPVVEQYEMLGLVGPVVERARRVILGLHGAEHARLRRMVNRAFTPRAVTRLASIARDYLNPRLPTSPATVNFLDDVIDGYPATVISHVLGVPAEDLPHLTRLADAISSAQFSMDADRLTAHAAAAAECDDYLRELVAAKRRSPGEDILTGLTTVTDNDDRLDDTEIVSIAASILNAGVDTLRHQACLGMLLFAEYPQQWRLLRTEPHLIDNAVEEVLRFRPVTPLLSRLTTAPVSHEGLALPARTFVSLAVAAANHDQELNPGNPDTFDVQRSNPRHFTFGQGPHFCLGSALARLELHELLALMSRRFSSVTTEGVTPRRPVMGIYGVRELTLRLSR